MQKLFVENIGGEKIFLDEEQSRHICKSLRMRQGDMITVCDGNKNDYGCIIEQITKEGVTLKICYKQASESEPSIRVSVKDKTTNTYGDYIVKSVTYTLGTGSTMTVNATELVERF